MATLAQFNFTGDSAAPTTTASGLLVSSIINNGLSLFSLGSLGYASDPMLQCNPIDGTTSAALAVTNNQYFYFTVTPQSGVSFSISDIAFSVARGGASTPRGWALRSSADSYASNLGTADTTSQRTTFGSASVNTSGVSSLQNRTSAVTFRMYLYAPNSGNSVDFDSITVNGSTAAVGTGTVRQEGFRFRADDGSQTTATWLAAQDTNIVRQKSTNTRLRVILDGTNDRGAEDYQLEYRNLTDVTPTWKKI